MIEILMGFIKAFLIGGAFCAIGQVMVDKTNITPARILSLYVVMGVILGGLGLYQPLVDWAGAGASIPLTGFGNALAQGVKKEVAEHGILGAFLGGFTAAAAGMTAAIVFGFVVALVCTPKEKQ